MCVHWFRIYLYVLYTILYSLSRIIYIYFIFIYVGHAELSLLWLYIQLNTQEEVLHNRIYTIYTIQCTTRWHRYNLCHAMILLVVHYI